jgi:hypothetical protein
MVKRIIKESSGENILHINRELYFGGRPEVEPHPDIDKINAPNVIKNIFFGGKSKVEPFTYPDLKEDLKYIATYVKGRDKKNLRILMSGVDTGKKYLIYFDIGSDVDSLGITSFDRLKKIDDEHYKLGSINYYFFRENPDDLNIILTRWFRSDPEVCGYCGFRISSIDDYTYLFEYNGNRY